MRLTKRQFLFGGTAVALTAAMSSQTAAQAPATELVPDVMSERMVRGLFYPVTTASNISVMNSRAPMVIVADASGTIVDGGLGFDEVRVSTPHPNLMAGPVNDPNFLAAQYQYTASTTKVVALLAIIDWLKEEAAGPTRVADRMPADPLLDERLALYARVLGRPISLEPRINSGGIEFDDEIDGRRTISELSVDEIMRFSMQFSTNDLLEHLSRHMQQTTGRDLRERMAVVCERLNMQDSRFVTVSGMSSQRDGARVDCVSTPAEMLHAVRVLDQLNPEFAPYMGLTLYQPANPRLATLRPEGFSTRVQYVEGVRTGEPVQNFAALSGPALSTASTADADDTMAGEGEAIDNESAAGGGETDEDVAAASDSFAPDEGEGEPRFGIAGVRLAKSGKLGAPSRRVRVRVSNSRGRIVRVWRNTPFTEWRTFVCKYEEPATGNIFYGWVSADTAEGRVNGIERMIGMMQQAAPQYVAGAPSRPAEPRPSVVDAPPLFTTLARH